MKIKTVVIAIIVATNAIQLAFAAGTNPNVDGIQWYHGSAEKKALYHQAFNVANVVVKAEVKAQQLAKNAWGIILDIDETVLDNSWAEYDDYKDYEFSENEQRQNKATATPGAVAFTRKIHERGGYVSLVTNRNGKDQDDFDATIANLNKENIYFDQVVFANAYDENKNDKNARFKAVESGEYPEDIILTKKLPAHQILAYFGDSIHDFPALHEQTMKDAKPGAFDPFGLRYFMMPNPMYGSWK